MIKISRDEKKLRESARGELCAFNIVGLCCGGTDTTVLCHAPSEMHGMALKGDGIHAAYGCRACHAALDQHELSRADEQFYWLRGIERTHMAMLARGVLVVA
jgi:hypothetical protein